MNNNNKISASVSYKIWIVGPALYGSSKSVDTVSGVTYVTHVHYLYRRLWQRASSVVCLCRLFTAAARLYLVLFVSNCYRTICHHTFPHRHLWHLQDRFPPSVLQLKHITLSLSSHILFFTQHLFSPFVADIRMKNNIKYQLINFVMLVLVFVSVYNLTDFIWPELQLQTWP